MDEVEEFCMRVLGAPEPAADAAARARVEAGEDRIARLRAAARECREYAARRNGDDPEDMEEGLTAPRGLAGAVARELAASTARLPDRQREALALRELLRLSYEQISQVMGIEQTAVSPLLARARLRLRAEYRGVGVAPGGACEDRDRALRVLASRQDSEPISADDDSWVLAHMATCHACETAHAAMLEASVCYRAWPRG